MRCKKQVIIAGILAVCIIISSCGKDTKNSNIEEDTTSAKAAVEEAQGTQTILPLESEDFYHGTWRGLFYYDVNNNKIESIDEQEGYYITFSETDIVVSNGDDVQSSNITTSDGIQTNKSGTDYFCVYYNDKDGNPVTVILTMMHISGEEANGVQDGDYLNVMTGNNGAMYLFLEKVHE